MLSPEYQPNGKLSADYAKELIEETFRNGSSSFEWIHIKSDGSQFIAKINLSIIDQSGEKIIFTTWQDITEKKKAEENLRKLSQAVEQSPVSIVITNLEGNIEYANPAACKTTGYSLNELMGQNPRVLKSGDTTTEEYKNLWNNISSGKLWHGIFHNRRKNGEYYWESSTIGPITDSTGQITHYLAVKEDITERKRFEEELALNERRYRQVTENSLAVVWEIDKNGLFKYLSDVSENVFGYTPEELTDKMHFYDLHPAENRDRFREEALAKMARCEEMKDLDNIVVKKDGQKIWVLTNGTPVLDSGNNLVGYIGVDIDISSRKTAEQELIKFMTIADKGNYGIAIAELDGLLTYSNDAFAQMHGYEVNEIIGRNLSMLHSEKQLARVYETIDLLKNYGEFKAEEVWRTKKDGTAFPSLMNAKIMMSDEGVPQFMWATTIDISTLKESEEALERSESNLNYAQEIAQMGSWELDIKNRQLTWSKNYYKLIELDDKVKPSQELFDSYIHPDDYHLIAEYQSKMMSTRKPVSFDMRLKMPNGNIKWVRNNVVPEFKDDELITLSGVNIDITYRKEIENALLEREEQLNHAQEIAKMGSWEYDVITGDLRWSKNYYRLLNHDINKPPIPFPEIKIMVHPDDRELFEEALKKIEKSGAIESFQFRMIFEDKSEKWIHVFMQPVFNENGLESVKGVSIDITEQKQNELEIKKLSMAIEQSPIAIVITDLEANVQYVSPAFYEMTGYTSEEVIGKNTNILKSGKTPKAIYVDLWDTITKGETWFGEWINRKKTGEFYWESVSISPITDSNNKVINYLAVKEEITQRKKAQQEILELNLNLEKKVEERTNQLAGANKELQKKTDELETFFSVALDLLCIADLDGNFLKLNKAWEGILGYNEEELKSRKFLDFVHPDDIQSTLDAMQELVENKPILEFINRYKTMNGEYRFIEWHSVPVGNYIYAAARDITDRKKYEEELTIARKVAENANQSKSEFLSRMSHELRTPMNSILGFAQLLKMGQLNPSQEKGVNHILKSGKHLLGLINEVLDISRIEAGRISISMEPVELGGLIGEVVDTVLPLAHDKNITITVDENSKGLFVISDKQRLKQVMINLINNAIKYNNQDGNIWIDAQVMPVNESGIETIKISVMDDGFGISEEDIPKLFTPFERIGAESSNTEGTGLGLAVVKKLVDLMEGSIGIESKLKKGSVFSIELHKAEKNFADMKKAAGIDESNNIKTTAGIILYVEDNISNIELVEQILKISRPNFKLITTMNGMQAEKMAEAQKPDLILLDLNLPDIHGAEVLKKLKTNSMTRNIPVVVVTADAMQKQLDNLIDAGAGYCITKPIDVQMLLKIADEIIV